MSAVATETMHSGRSAVTQDSEGGVCRSMCAGLEGAAAVRVPMIDAERDVVAEPDVAAEPVVAAAQRRWAARPLVDRLQVVRSARRWMATHAAAFAEAISPALQRSGADTLATELLPLLDAMRFLERRAQTLLATQRLGRNGRPVWLMGVAAEVQRVPLGHVLVIGPANFPLFLPGTQAVQALVAGNAVTWKPGAGGCAVARLFAHGLREAGLPRGILCVTEESVEAAQQALAQRPDKVVFTGSLESGSKVLRVLAETATPAVMELSGADAVVVLPSADLDLVAKAVAFGLRLNGAEVCMSPRRLIAPAETLKALLPLLEAELLNVPAVMLAANTAKKLAELVDEAVGEGAWMRGAMESQMQRPLLIEGARPEMRIAQADVFAPVLCLIEAPNVLVLPELVNACPYGLTAAVFGEAKAARALGDQMRVGTVLVNDLIAPTADPRVPFGGRGRSGFGATRGAEGLLEMTAPKTVLVRRKGVKQHYAEVGARDVPLFTALIAMLHGGSARERWRAVRALVRAGRQRKAA
jgi:acyl-CoA reductase-like NAD-dependent aldehyde dehydrogenase